MNCFPNELEQREDVWRRDRGSVMPDQAFRVFYSMFTLLRAFLRATGKVGKGVRGMTLLGGLTGYLAFRPKAEDLAFNPNVIR